MTPQDREKSREIALSLFFFVFHFVSLNIFEKFIIPNTWITIIVLDLMLKPHTTTNIKGLIYRTTFSYIIDN